MERRAKSMADAELLILHAQHIINIEGNNNYKLHFDFHFNQPRGSFLNNQTHSPKKKKQSGKKRVW